MEKIEKQSWKEKCYHIFWLFLIGSIFGCIYETIICILDRGHFEFRQGLIYGPFVPIYGIGLLLLVVVASHKKHLYSIFLSCAFLGGITEYICSWVQENIFGTISWSYTKNWMNFDGRTSPFHMLIWGVLGVLFIKLVYPYVQKMLSFLIKKERLIITHILIGFMIFNITISLLACYRQTERTRKIPPKNAFDQLLDKWYPDVFLDTIYANKKVVQK